MDVALNYVETWDEAQSFMSWLSERRPVLGLDTETAGLEWWHMPLRLVQLGDATAGWAVPWYMWGGLVKDALQRYSGPIALHNAKFDVHFLEESGVALNRSQLHDTRVMAHLIDPASPTALKTLASRIVDPGATAGQEALTRGMTENKWTWATVPTDFVPYWSYGALDPVLTARLYEHFRPLITGKLNDVYELEIACSMVLLEMERRGARVDLEYCEGAQARRYERAALIADFVKEQYDIKVGSNNEVAAAMQREGAILKKQTAGGAWSVDEEVLSGFAKREGSRAEVLAYLTLEYRRDVKYAKTYFGAYQDLADGDLVHPDVNPLGARTGRMSISRPSLQNVPREADLRDAFIPREGNRLVSVDFDQIEARLLTNFSDDEGLHAAFLEEGDFFTNMARRIYMDPRIEKSDLRRQITKSSIYAKMYGAGARKFALTAGITVPEAETFYSRLDQQFPGIGLFMKSIEQTARVNQEKFGGVPFVETPLGRRQPSDGSGRDFALVNYMVQGTAADIFKQTVVELDMAGLCEHFVIPVHDECLFDAPAEDAEELMHEVQRVFERDRGFRTQLTAGGDVMERWGDKFR